MEFNKEDWESERSSGFAGYRNKKTSQWIYDVDYRERIAPETWQPSVKLRWVERKEEKLFEFPHTITAKVLQQLYVSSSGKTEWRDVEIINE